MAVHTSDILRAWRHIITGYKPVLSIEITNKCPLDCPGCYAYNPDHLEGGLESLSDYSGDDLVQGILDLLDLHRPMAVFLVGGEPLVRHRELSKVLPQIAARGMNSEIVTSAVVSIPKAWDEIDKLRIVISIDGLQPEHDERRKPATYDRILKHIEGRYVYIHCTITSQMMEREGYLEEFVKFWSARPEVGAIRLSFFTPQVDETSVEILTPEMREGATAEMGRLRLIYPKLELTESMLRSYLSPPQSPAECAFARTTQTISADLQTFVEPCQFGGTPDCSQCGCAATMGLDAVQHYRLPGGLRVGTIFEASERIGGVFRWARNGKNGANGHH